MKIKSVLKKILFKLVDYSLLPPTKDEIKLLKEYQSKFNTIDSSNYTINKDWNNNINLLKELVKKNDLRCFLRWNVIQNTMFVSYSHYIIKEFFYLKRDEKWKKLWRDAIQENHAGYPLPFIFYKKSSANLIHHAFQLAKFQETTKISYNHISNIIEFGGGYGSMCRLLKNLNFNGKYFIYDLAPFSLLQEFYLKLLSLKNQNYINNTYSISDLNLIKKKFKEAAKISSGDNLFIATWSLSESPIEIRSQIEEIFPYFKYILITYQDKFGEYNNVKYFIDIQKKFPNYNWVCKSIKHMPKNYYLFGKS